MFKCMKVYRDRETEKEKERQGVVCACFFSLSLPTKLHCYGVIMCAVKIWGQDRGMGRVSGCPTYL